MTAALVPVLVLLAGAAGSAWGQAGIYTCVDGHGKRITSDRPIVECLDREQKELNPTGTVRRIVPPSLTAAERAVQEERERKLADERMRAAEERRMQRALLTRYPHPAVHDAEREKALQAQQEVIATAQRRVRDLREERARLEAETEYYKTPAEWPAKLKRQFEENDQQISAQQRYVHAHEDELKRITRRFDEELARLKLLWARSGAATAAAPAAATVPAAR
ncbi:MAG TPA: DUF4124 domain-containing protein [Ramlibacter sp.]|nr:DUF4124 domain-containing protein [Ramlibacter sp.]